MKVAKKREYVQAARWTGEVTPEVTAILGDHKFVIGTDRMISLGNGWYAEVGDWLIVHDGEKVGVVSHKVFDLVYEPVDDDAPARQPTAEEHAVDVRAFVEAVDAVLMDGLRLSREHHPNIFHASNVLQRKLRELLEDHSWRAAAAERRRIKDRIAKEIL